MAVGCVRPASDDPAGGLKRGGNGRIVVLQHRRDDMAIENITAHGNNGLVTFTDRDSSDFTATITLTALDVKSILMAMGNDWQDLIIIEIERRRAKEAVAEMLANRKADREERAARRQEMRQEMRDSYAG
jgi:hypothetical protein